MKWSTMDNTERVFFILGWILLVVFLISAVVVVKQAF